MNLISRESELAKKYALTCSGGLVELSIENVALVSAMIQNDSDYSRSSDKSARPNNKGYKGSTAYWMCQLKTALLTKSSDLNKIIEDAVKAVDRENSTHLNADGIGIDVLTKRIFDKRKTLINELKDRKKGFKLIEYLAERTDKRTSISKDGKVYYPRENYSFATKFCHYACIHFFEKEDNEFQDNYSIYDNIVAEALPSYLQSRKITKKNGKPYTKGDYSSANQYELYSNLIDELRQSQISRSGFDHLLWYFHKVRN